jgi:hypothetical protein
MSIVLTLLTVLGIRHPMHSSSAILDFAPDQRVVRVTIRVYADDFPPGSDSREISGYLSNRFTMTDRLRASMPLRLQRIRAEGPVLVLELTAAAPTGLAGTRVWHGVLAERFSDQVNIVQARYAGRTASLLFTATDGAKALP